MVYRTSTYKLTGRSKEEPTGLDIYMWNSMDLLMLLLVSQECHSLFITLLFNSDAIAIEFGCGKKIILCLIQMQ